MLASFSIHARSEVRTLLWENLVAFECVFISSASHVRPCAVWHSKPGEFLVLMKLRRGGEWRRGTLCFLLLPAWDWPDLQSPVSWQLAAGHFLVEGTGMSRAKALFSVSVLCQAVVSVIFPLLWSLLGGLALGLALGLTLESWQGPQICSCGSVSSGAGRYPGGFGCSVISICRSWKKNQRPLCLREYQESCLNSQQAQSEHRFSVPNHRIWETRKGKTSKLLWEQK